MTGQNFYKIMEKKIYRSPVMELVEFDLRNVIVTTSGNDDFVDEGNPGGEENPYAAPKRPNAIWD